VLSGDTVVILGEQAETKGSGPAGPPPEIQLTLLGLKAPLLGKKNKDEAVDDQPYAWESREYLRKLLIGATIVYRVEHETPNRSYGEVWLQKQNVRNLVIENGWAEVQIKERKDKEGQPQPPRKEEQDLLAIQTKAQEKKLGMWSKDGKKHIRNVTYHENKKGTNPDVLFSFFEKNKNSPLTAIVEQVRSGSILRVYVPSKGDEFTINLSGIHCPVFRFNDESACEPFSREAKFFTEHCLLNQEVIVTIESMDKLNNYFGTVLDAKHKRNVGVNLLKMGLGQFVEWNVPSAEIAKEWRDAEKEAREAKLRVWKKWKPTDNKSNKAFAREFLGTVEEIVTPGSIVVRVQKGDKNVDVPVNFSSIRLPRLAPKDKGEAADQEEKPETKPAVPLSEKEKRIAEEKKAKVEEEKIQNAWAIVAKEYLRKELIGKKVRVVFDYDSPPFQPPGSKQLLPARPHYSVYLGQANIAERLVRKGYATVTLHHEGESRSPQYKELILAEKAAKTAPGYGLHAPKKNTPNVHVNDLSSESEAKCRGFLTSLQRIARVPAIVEYVFWGSRYKIHIPTQGLTIGFSLQGASSERPTKLETKNKPTGNVDVRQLYPAVDGNGAPNPSNVALHYSRDHLHQRDVEIQISEVDKSGAFLGTLYLNKSDYLLQLLPLGHAKLFRRTIEKLPGSAQYITLEDKARKEKRGLWFDYDEAAEQARRDEYEEKRAATIRERDEGRAKEKLTNITVTEIMTGSTFFFQTANEETSQLMEDLMADIQSRGWKDKPVHAPELHEWVIAKFSADNNWYRAEVLRVTPAAEGSEAQYEIRYVDYGNTEVVTTKSIRKMDPDFASSKYAARARKGKLAYIRAPALEDEFGEDSAALFKELVWGKTMVAQIQFKEGDDDYKPKKGGKEEQKEDKSNTRRNVVYHVLLGDKEEMTNVSGVLVMEGLARVEGRRKTRVVNVDFYKKLGVAEAKAKSSRLAIWQYGAIPDSDEERQWAQMLK